jgi:hypothetical protein
MRRAYRHGLQHAVPPLQPRRVVPCDSTVQTAAGTVHVHYVSLGVDETRVAGTIRLARSGTRRAVRAMMGTDGGPLQVTLADDRGTTATAHFGGGGNDVEWEGAFHSDQPLARDTAWIEIDGERIDLAGEAPQAKVEVEALPEEDPALRYLWRRVAAPDHFHEPDEMLEAAIEVLAAAGALSADSHEVQDVRAVAEAVRHGGQPRRSARQLPEPWRSLLSRGRRTRGPTGTIAVGAVTPQFDGVSVAVTSIESTPDGFSVDVEIAPGLLGRGPFDGDVGGPSLVWWAADDRGNHFLGHMGGWSGSDTHTEGTVEFEPALDPRATELRLLPTAQTQRCVITVPLPWARPK